MRIVKKLIMTILVSILLVGTVALGWTTDGFKNWDSFDGNKVNADSIEAGKIYSEKYGTFVIPEQNMFFALNSFVGMIGVDNGTDFTYLFDEYMTAIAKVNNYDPVVFKDENQMLIATGLEVHAYSGGVRGFMNSVDYPFKNSLAYAPEGFNRVGMCLYLHNNIFNYDLSKFVKISYGMPYPTFNVTYTSKEKLKNVTDDLLIKDLYGLTADESTYATLAVRCLGRKVTIAVEGQADVTTIIPIMITSDKGYPMTEQVYREIQEGIK